MRPYWGIIKDSFHEALVSRVLWVLIILTTLFLAAIVPFSLKQMITPEISSGDIVNPDSFATRLVEKGKNSAKSPESLLWNKFSDDMRRSLSRLVEEKNTMSFPLLVRLTRELNDLVDDPGLYNSAAWDGVEFSDETMDLIAAGMDSLDTPEKRELNRRLLADAFGEHLPLPESTSIQVGYMSWKSNTALPGRKKDLLDDGITKLTNICVGWIGMIVAILVTAYIIPRTFEAGSVDMLFSKPVHRSFVFLTRFLGGCAFITLLTAYFVGGLCLIAGLRLGYWNARLLLIVPVLAFNFLIFYAVSALIGVVWRNTIMCIFLTLLFWFACWAFGVTVFWYRTLFFLPKTKVAVEKVDESILGFDLAGQGHRWVSASREWELAFPASMNQNPQMGQMPLITPVVGPVYDKKQKRILVFQFGQPFMNIADPNDGFKQQQGPELPPLVRYMFVESSGNVITVSSQFVYRLVREDGRDVFQTCSPPLGFGFPFAASQDPEADRIILQGRRGLLLLKLDTDGRYVVAAKNSQAVSSKAMIGLTNKHTVVLSEDGKTVLYDRDLKQIRKTSRFDGREPRQITVGPEGKRLAILFHDEELYLFEDDSAKFRKAPVRHQGSITAASFSDEEFLVAGDFTRVDTYDAETFVHRKAYYGKMSGAEKAFRYGIRPLYAIFPKPSEISNLALYAVTGEKTTTSQDLGSLRLKRNIWQPFWSSLIFTIIVLNLSCLYVARKDY